MDSDLLEILQRPGTLVFPENRRLLPDLAAAGGRAVQTPTGHLIFHGPHGRRILATDPEGHPLHECEWDVGQDGHQRLVRARLHLDWGRWIGLRPGGIVRSTTLDLSKKPGWEQLQTNDLRHMAARAMGVSLDEVRFFYPDEDLLIGPNGRATIRHRKDAFYVLEDDTFERARFMACMGAMHWERIDFLPVVELFQSLLPGTGSAAFELIRGLYDDQNQRTPRPLHYRGIPTYPSEAAYRLFGTFFVPHVEGGRDPFSVFVEASTSHEVSWLPAPDPPVRCFDPSEKLCVTMKADRLSKVTASDDATGLPYTSPRPDGFCFCERWFEVEAGHLLLHDGPALRKVAVRPSWGKLADSRRVQAPAYRVDWRSCLGESFRKPDPDSAFSAVLLYPDDRSEIEEGASQPFAADYIQDAFEQDRRLKAYLDRAQHVLIDGFDAALRACLHLAPSRRYTILYRDARFVQKFIQSLWNRLAESGRLDLTAHIACASGPVSRNEAYQSSYDMIYAWTPFAHFDQEGELTAFGRALGTALAPGGLACIVGPERMSPVLRASQLIPLTALPVQDLSSFHMHLTLLPDGMLKSGLTLFYVTR